ncbi:LacI family DNA-binding transcriptional regulator [Bifidobacterium pseudocatenulatum]|uniref:LacI family DNA-binding transcriptional regulator n=1 Tax=Bifidobacterium pseudocatenulatum TaxID=28026 RepID=UPI003D06BDF5
MAKPTIANVAELAGVSQATVSRALRGATNVTEETRIKVQRGSGSTQLHTLKKRFRPSIRKNHARHPPGLGQTQRVVQFRSAPRGLRGARAGRL